MLERSETRTGQLLGGKYLIEALIARGGMGLVYSARHRGTGRSVALKLLRPELVTRSDLVRRISAEARVAVEASHPNVVEVLDAGADDEGVPYLVLERLYGCSLDAYLASPIALLPVTQALVPIFNALVSLHAAGIVHRDIKPSNLFLNRDRDGRITPKLLDFGIAKVLAEAASTLSGVALGTPAYMAPEQALGYHAVGPAADVWSMGVVFVRCLTGELPFETKSFTRPEGLRSSLQLAELPNVPEPLGRVLMRALRFEPAERFASMAEFRVALLSALAQIDASQPWPDAGSVNYAAHETEISSWLGSASADPASPAEAEPKDVRRPTHVPTKTLRDDSSSVARMQQKARRTRLVAGASLALLGAIGFRALQARAPQPSQEEDSAPPAPLAATQPHGGEPIAEAVPERAAPASTESAGEQPAALQGSPPASAMRPDRPREVMMLKPAPPRTRGQSSSPTVQSEPSQRTAKEEPASSSDGSFAPGSTAPDPGDAAEPSRTERRAQRSPRSSAGANRAPIID